MVFWRKKKNIAEQEREEEQDKILHPKGDPELEPSTDYDPELDDNAKEEIAGNESADWDDLDETPVPSHTPVEDVQESKDLSDHSNEGGWLSRLSSGLSKSSNKITKGLGDLITKRKLDQETLDQLEEVLLMADLGPQTAAKIIEDFSKDRFGKEVEESEIKEALAVSMEAILKPVAQDLEITKPENGPFVILVCGVNGVGKTTTIGKFAHFLKREKGFSVFVAAGDTFRAAAVEQLEEWAKRAGAGFLAKDLGADAASVAYESYAKAKEQGSDVLMIDTAGRLHNKANLMAELEKIVRVLKKQDESLPHSTLLVLDATTGQNAFAQVETFKECVNVSGLIVTKLDGSAKGGVLVGLADKFGLPVNAIGIGEQAEDMQPFKASEYARSLMGLN